MDKLIKDENLSFKNEKGNDALTRFYTEEENTLRLRHFDEFMNSKLLADNILERLQELEEKISPYFDSGDTPENLTTLKTPFYSYISQIKFGVFAQDNYDVDLKPQDDDPETKEKVEKLDLVLKTELMKARANKYIKEALLTSRKSLFGATLLTWKNPHELGEDDVVSASPFEFTNINPKTLYWDPNYDKIEKMSYVYVLRQITWWEIVDHPILGQKKDLLLYIQNKYATDRRQPSMNQSDSQYDKNFDSAAPKSDESRNFITNTLVLKTKFWLKNKGSKDQKCMISYFLWEDTLLATVESGSSMIPISVIYEYKNPGDFYGTNTIYNLNSLISNYELLLQDEYNKIQEIGKKYIFYEKNLKIDIDMVREDESKNNLIWVATDEILPNQGILKVDPSDINASTLAFIQDQERFIYQMAGIDKIVQGDTKSIQSAQGVAGVLQEARLLDESCLNYLQDYVERINAIALEYIIKKYNGINKEAKIRVQKQVMDMEEDGVDYEFIKIPKGKFHKLKVDILPNFNITSSINRAQSLNTLLSLLAQDAQRKDGTKIFPDPQASLEALKLFIPNYKQAQLSLARAKSAKWGVAAQAIVQNTMRGLAEGQEVADIEDEAAAGLQNLARGQSPEEQPLEEAMPPEMAGGLPPEIAGGLPQVPGVGSPLSPGLDEGVSPSALPGEETTIPGGEESI